MPPLPSSPPKLFTLRLVSSGILAALGPKQNLFARSASHSAQDRELVRATSSSSFSGAQGVDARCCHIDVINGHPELLKELEHDISRDFRHLTTHDNCKPSIRHNMRFDEEQPVKLQFVRWRTDGREGSARLGVVLHTIAKLYLKIRIGIQQINE